MRLRAYRLMLGISQAKLSSLLGVSELSVLKYESGRTIPSREVMLRVYELTSGAVTPNDFFDLDLIGVKNKIENIPQASRQKTLTVVGLMSGTSMDGIDAALIVTDGERYVKELGSSSINYDPSFKAQLKQAERAVFEAQGDLKTARIKFPQFDEVLERSSELHVEATNKLLKESGYRPSQIDLIGYHGQTLFHSPQRGITLQIGDGQLLADRLGVPVICDFRSNDVQHGGQGAPFAPLYHEALAQQMGLAPVVVANCGGISNITVITGRSSELAAFDCGPGNGLIDRFVQARTGKACDLDGVFGLQGKIHEEVVELFFKTSLLRPDGRNYFDLPPPKSLDINDMKLIPALEKLSLQDGCATLEAFTARCIVRGLRWITEKGIPVPVFWVLAGGGWNNPVIVRELQNELKGLLGDGVKVQHAEAVGWDGKALEAQIFAYLAVRSKYGLPLSVPGTTGVPEPMTGGKMVTPLR